jgi:hypothetical protein
MRDRRAPPLVTRVALAPTSARSSAQDRWRPPERGARWRAFGALCPRDRVRGPLSSEPARGWRAELVSASRFVRRRRDPQTLSSPRCYIPPWLERSPDRVVFEGDVSWALSTITTAAPSSCAECLSKAHGTGAGNVDGRAGHNASCVVAGQAWLA